MIQFNNFFSRSAVWSIKMTGFFFLVTISVDIFFFFIIYVVWRYYRVTQMKSLGFGLNRQDISWYAHNTMRAEPVKRSIASDFKVNHIRIYFYKIYNHITFTVGPQKYDNRHLVVGDYFPNYYQLANEM